MEKYNNICTVIWSKEVFKGGNIGFLSRATEPVCEKVNTEGDNPQIC